MAKQEIQEALLHAAVAAMRPYVRHLLASGVTFGQLEARLRELVVEMAERDLARTAPPTDSRVSILTGINRKEVRRLRARDRQTAPRTFTRNLAASLISRWVNDSRTTDSGGRPLPLPYDAARGPSFVALARATTVDLRPRALLEVLVAAGAAVLQEGAIVALTRDAYVPRRGHRQGLAMLADDPPELIETMLHNVLGDGTQSRLQQKLAYDNIGSDGLERLRARLRREAERFLARSNAALQRHDRDRTPHAPGGARTYAGIGVYYFETPHQQEQPDPPAAPVRAPRIRPSRRIKQ